MKKQLFALVGMLLALNLSALDVEAGRQSYVAKCASCHGMNAEQPIMPVYPKLAGQNAPYFIKQINDFKSGKRQDVVMGAMAQLLTSDDEVANVAAYLEALPVKSSSQ